MPSSNGSTPRDFALGIAPFTYADLYEPDRLADLSLAFDEELTRADAALAQTFAEYRGGKSFKDEEVSDLLIRAGTYLGPFVARLFGVERELKKLTDHAKHEDVLFSFKR